MNNRLLQIKKLIEKNKIWEESAPVNFYFLTIWNAFVSVKKYLGYAYDHIFVIYKNKNLYEFSTYNDKENIRNIAMKARKENADYINSLREMMSLKKEKLLLMAPQIDTLKKDSVKNFYLEFMALFEAGIGLSLITEGFDNYSDEILPQQISEAYNLSPSQANHIISILSTSEEMNHMTLSEIDLLNLCLKNKGIISKQFDNLSDEENNSLDKYASDHLFIKNSFTTFRKLNRKDVYDLISKEMDTCSIETISEKLDKLKSFYSNVKSKKESIIDKHNISSEHILIFDLLSEISLLQDDRKSFFLVGNYYLTQLMKKISEIYKIENNVLFYYLYDDILGLFDGESLEDDKINSRKNDGFIFYSGKYGRITYEGKDIDRLLDLIQEKFSSGTIKGFVSFKSKEPIEGKVNVVLDPHNEHFEDGSILVTTMTRPDFFPIMKRAKAIVTNEGGITSHAAIISREFEIPCIIGTKNATKVLKTGDIVEIDTENGIVRKIK